MSARISSGWIIILRVSSHLLHKSRNALHANEPKRRAFERRLEICRASVLFHHQELELKITKEFAARLASRVSTLESRVGTSRNSWPSSHREMK